MRSLILRDWEVRAILDGRLTQLRRVVTSRWLRCLTLPDDIEQVVAQSPFGSPGDVLWVKEAWAMDRFNCPSICTNQSHVLYRANFDDEEAAEICWRSPVHMPRWASRITLGVVRTWVERVQESGVDAGQWNLDNPRNPWESNPWVWAAEVRKVER